MMRGRGVGADTGWRVTPGKGADSGDSVGALAASGGVVGLILWSNTGRVTDSSSLTDWGGRSLRVGDGKPSSKKTTSGLNDNSFFRVPNAITASTYSPSVVKLPQPFGSTIAHLVRGSTT